MREPTQAERLIGVLADGQWHTSRELYDLYMVVHSVVSALRKRGYVIECDRDPSEPVASLAFRYRLLSPYVVEQIAGQERLF